MARTVYFGNSTYQTWIKAPASNMDASATGYVNKIDFLNGGASVRRSNRTSRQFAMSWNGQMNGTDQAENLQIVKDFYDGLYGAGPFFWLDPFATESNLFAPHWAAPMLDELDWPSISATVTPTFTAGAYSNAYPIKYATYALAGSHADTRKFTIIIPTGYTLHFGWHSTLANRTASSAAGVRIVPYNLSGVAQTAVNPNSLLAGGTTRTNATFAGSSYSKVEIFLANGSASASSVNIVAMIAQVLKNGSSVASGGFISGRGTAQLEFSDAPKMTYISSGINNGQIEMSANFTEVV
ncbi:hypothetical protein UFOVP536_21 [uncultured Caudovirales phage]|uniref:Minor tail protein n=1 Tax=uncultured Caudovirales phage TaxID=2100421 RepID=A0A6J5MPZ3_9CAUD|nr:hypothetical protein UFOVP536_21 [uncultured Caudovirales phage]